MTKIFMSALFVLASLAAFSQKPYETIQEGSTPIYKGLITRELLEKEPTFTWYAGNAKGYTPDAGAVSALKAAKDSVKLLVFMGTWCEDSHYIIPKFFALSDAAGFPAASISLIGVDRSKKTLGHLTDMLNVLNVPTIIVMKNGKEVGRVVEYGKTGAFDKDLSAILSN